VNTWLNKNRKKILNAKWKKFIEPVLIAIVGAFIAFVLPLIYNNDCHSKADTKILRASLLSYNCPEDQYNPLATLLFNDEGVTVRAYLSYQTELAVTVPLIYFLYWYVLTVYTYGTAVPAGLFFPGILIGCSLGHFVARFAEVLSWVDQTQNQTYALVGAAATLSGYTRLGFCIAILLMETAEDVNLFIPMLIGTMISRGISGLLSGSLYKNAIKLKHIPMISRKVKESARETLVGDIMVAPVVTFSRIETVKTVYQVLSTTTHNGFPVLDNNNRVCGKISRNFLITLIENKQFTEKNSPEHHRMSIQRESVRSTARNRQVLLSKDRANLLPWPKFNADYHSTTKDYKTVEEIAKANEDKMIDIESYMILNPYTIPSDMDMKNAILVFHENSLRHLPCVNPENNELVGILTREEIAHFLDSKSLITS